MIKSMTGFGSSEANIPGLGKAGVEMRSVNHRFLDVICHLPEGFSYLEEKIKKEIARKIGRGRITCQFSIIAGTKEKFLINKQLLKEYHHSLDSLRKQLGIKQPLALDTLIHLPGVLSIEEKKGYGNRIWSKLRPLVNAALLGLVRTRSKEGSALYLDLRERSEDLKANLEAIRKRFKKVIREKVSRISAADEQASFIKSSDITEEIVRIRFHINNFKKKIRKSGLVGKELDFIAQELSRESNTMGAKSIDAIISSSVVAMKSQIEKVREQLQNVE